MKHIENLILDMDGVLWNGETPTTDIGALFDQLRRHNIGFVLATNNATKTPDQYVKKFERLGATVEKEQICTSAESTASYLAEHYPKGTTAYVLGGDGIHLSLASRGFEIVNDEHPDADPANFTPAEIVVVALSWDATYKDFADAAVHINAGGTFYGTNPDTSFPSEYGRLPGAGSFLALLMAATGTQAIVIGKPNRPMFLEALKRVGGTPENTAMVGDRLDTDIKGANNVGLTSIMVLTGISTQAEADAGDVKPTYIVENIAALVAQLTTKSVAE